MPEGYAIQAIQAVLSGQRAYCKFLAANDTGLTGGHQAGIGLQTSGAVFLSCDRSIQGRFLYLQNVMLRIIRHLY